MPQPRSRSRRVLVAAVALATAVLPACTSGSGGDGAAATKAGETTTLPPREPGVEFPVANAEAAAEDLAALALRGFAPEDPTFGTVTATATGSWQKADIDAATNLVAATTDATPETISWNGGIVDFTKIPVVGLPFAVADGQKGCAFGIVYVEDSARTAPKSKVVVAPAGTPCNVTAAVTTFEDGGLVG